MTGSAAVTEALPSRAIVAPTLPNTWAPNTWARNTWAPNTWGRSAGPRHPAVEPPAGPRTTRRVVGLLLAIAAGLLALEVTVMPPPPSVEAIPPPIERHDGADQRHDSGDCDLVRSAAGAGGSIGLLGCAPAPS